MRKCSWDRRLLRLLRGRLFGGFPGKHRDTDAGLQLVLPVDDDLLVGFEARVDQRLAIAYLRHLDRADRHGAVGIDHVRVGAVRPLLHDACRNRQSVMAGGEKQPTVDELTGPEHALRVGEIGAKLVFTSSFTRV